MASYNMQGGEACSMQTSLCLCFPFLCANPSSVVFGSLLSPPAMDHCNQFPPAQHCRKCKKNSQGQPGGACNGGLKRYLSDLFHGTGGNDHSRGGVTKMACFNQPKMDEYSSERRWVPLETGYGQGNRSLAQFPGCGFVYGNTSDSGLHSTPFDFSHGVTPQQYHGSPCELGGKTWKHANGDIGGLVSLDSPQGQGSPSPELQSHLQDLDAQVRSLRGDLQDMKKDISHLATFVQISNSEVCSSTEPKVDCVRTSSGNSPSVILNSDDGNVGTTMGSKDKMSRKQHEN